MDEKEVSSEVENINLVHYNNIHKFDRFFIRYFTLLPDFRHKFLLFSLLVLGLIISSDLFKFILNDDILKEPYIASLLISGLISAFVFIIYIVIFLLKKDMLSKKYWDDFFSYFNSAFEIAIYVIIIMYAGNSYTYENSTLFNMFFICLLGYLGLFILITIRTILFQNSYSQDSNTGINLSKLSINAQEDSFLQILLMAGILSLCLIVSYIFTSIHISILLLIFLFLIHFLYVIKIYLTGIVIEP
ncbi:MAG: hypothetical protein LAT82_03690 [Nanoarchaeota archaeon]|nr:hypothetical protein [Nanoarchaeota archaeon]